MMQQQHQVNPFDLLSSPPPTNTNPVSPPVSLNNGYPSYPHVPSQPQYSSRDDMSLVSAPPNLRSQTYPSDAASVVSYRSVQSAHTTQRIPSPAPVQGRMMTELEMAYANPKSPLPIADKVVASGFILARISFRTILLKKWRQAYWIQYGPVSLYIFRSVADYEDWLKNPFHAQRERDYLVKLKIDFIADILPQDVREYRTTQTTRKTYGRNKPLYHQFKLERVMEFGPTIVAGFASQDPGEVDALRRSINQCMRNSSNSRGWGSAPAVPNHSMQSAPPENGAVVQYYQQQQAYQNYKY